MKWKNTSSAKWRQNETRNLLYEKPGLNFVNTLSANMVETSELQ